MLPGPIVNSLDFIPSLVLVGDDLLRQAVDLCIAAFDFRAGSQVLANIGADFFNIGKNVNVGVVRRKNRAALDYESDKRLGLLPCAQLGNLHGHDFDRAVDDLVIDLDPGRNVFVHDFDLLFGPVGRNGCIAGYCFARAGACGDDQPGPPAEGLAVAHFNALRVGLLELGENHARNGENKK